MSQSRKASWSRFCVWAIVGAVLVTGLIGAFGVLVFLLPLGALGIALLARGGRSWPEAIGLGGGVGALALAVAYLNRNYHSCPPAPRSGRTYSGYRAPVCSGGTNPVFWLVLGVALTLVSVAAFGVLRSGQGKGRVADGS
jgi:heme A synthase